MRFHALLMLAALAGCPSKKQQEPAEQKPYVGEVGRSDGGITGTVTNVGPGDLHVDDDGAPHAVQAQQQPNRPGRPIDVTLRSTPPGAQVAVDGAVLGNTPSYWSGMADGREHEFVFTMRGYAIARYRFVPVSSGVIHGRLDPIHEETDDGVPAPPPEVMAPKATGAVTPPNPPTTVVQDAADVPPGPVPGPVGPTPSAGSSDTPVGPQP